MSKHFLSCCKSIKECYCGKYPKQETFEESIKQQFKYDNLQDAKEISSKIKVVVETLEEAKKYAELAYYGDEVDVFVNGVKWQQERSHSNEEVKKMFYIFLETAYNGKQKESLDKWLEQFKK